MKIFLIALIEFLINTVTRSLRACEGDRTARLYAWVLR